MAIQQSNICSVIRFNVYYRKHPFYVPGMGGSGRFFFLRKNNITTAATAAVPTTAIPTPTPAPIAGPLELLSSSDGQRKLSHMI